MTDQELRKLRRIELMELLLTLSRENEALTEQVASLQAALEDRRIALEKTGSIADAALALNGVFEAAQAAVEQYRISIEGRYQQLDEEISRREQESEKKAQQHLRETRIRCDTMLEETQREIDAKWAALSQQLSGVAQVAPAAVRELESEAGHGEH